MGKKLSRADTASIRKRAAEEILMLPLDLFTTDAERYPAVVNYLDMLAARVDPSIFTARTEEAEHDED